MERRVLLAISLSILVLYAYQVFLAPPPRRPATPAKPAAAATPVPGAETAPIEAAAPAPETPPPASVVSDVAERTILVRTGVAEITLTNRGARAQSWRLTRHLDQGRPVDLVPSSVKDQLKPLSLRVDNEDTTRRLNNALYRVAGENTSVIDASQAPAALVFEYEEVGGLRATKELRFQPGSYLVTMAVSVTEGAQTLNPWTVWGPGLTDIGAQSAGGSFFTGNYVQAPEAIYYRDGDVVRVASQSVTADPYEGDFLFAGIDDHYFLVATVKPGVASVRYRPVTVSGGEGVEHKFIALEARGKSGQPLTFFAGAKDFESLRTVDPQLVYTINFGIFQWLVVPLLQALKWVYGFVGNYGWAIIILTILINVVMFPLRHKSLVSMRKMQLIQPQVKAIQDRYAHLKMTDPARQKMNTEIMNLYREKGANPASGCVPMLLTMPVLLAFYSLLSQSIELRGAPFVLWIHDLSQKDPYYVTPLLMGATMFWQQWMAPTTADPMQQRMMMVMPVVFTVMFLGFPSGLAIYYLVSNLFQIGQQYFTNRVIGPPPRPVTERR